MLSLSSSPLRQSQDTGLLLHAILDGIVDMYFPIIDFYAGQMNIMDDLVQTDAKTAYTKSMSFKAVFIAAN